MQTPFTILIADDNEVYCAGLSVAIEDLTGAKIMDIVHSTEVLLQKIAALQPQIVLLDAQLPPANAIDACRHIHTTYPSTGIIIISHNYSKWLVNELLQAGAWAILFENASKLEIQMCLTATLSRHGNYPTQVNGINYITVTATTPQLSEKEIMLVQMICEELNTEEIAKKMYLSPYTIDNMRKALLRKFGVKNSIGIVMQAIKLGIVSV